MAAWYTAGLKELVDRTIPSDAVFKIMLVKTTYAYNADHTFVDDGTSGDPSSHEIVATNYAGGFAGSGRKTATLTWQSNNTANRVEAAIASLTWSTIGGATNDTIGGLVLYRSNSTDGNSRLIAFLDPADTPTNGNNITFTFLTLVAGGNLRITV